MANLFSSPSPGGPNNKENKQLATVISGTVSFLAGPTVYRHTVGWVLGIAAQTYPPEVLSVVDSAWFALVHLLLFLTLRAPVFAALSIATVYTAARFIH